MKTFNLIFILSLMIQAPNAFSLTAEEVREGCRQEIMARAKKDPIAQDKSAYKINDLAENIVDEPSKMIRNLLIMDDKKLTKKELEVMPWSDNYWPIYEGMLGRRYNDPEMRFSAFKSYFEYYQKNPVEKLIEAKEFSILSPSEKYDYLLGFGSVNLTEQNWKEGKAYQDQYGNVETWMGLCHGWAAAAMVLPKPVRTVNINVNGNEVPFYVSDIKALGTLLFANGNFETKFVGGRCNTKNPKVDDLDRPVENDCLDTNPGTWHLAVVNQLGVFNRSMIMDATYDYQVWNQPIASYDYAYYNPKNDTEVKTFKEALVKRSEWTKDPFKKVRSPKAEFIVGIIMNLSYVRETSPSIEENQEDLTTNLSYEYDLELDRDYNIVGGEWGTSNHPDFLWVPVKNSFPETVGDSGVNTVDLNLLDSEIKAKAKANIPYNLPFGPLVKELFEQSKSLE
jgi:hypothetical protein